MKKIVLVGVCAAAVAGIAATLITGVDSYAIGRNAGYMGSANRSVFVGPGAGAYIDNADSNVVIGAAAALDGNAISSSIALGHYALRNASDIDGVIAIGDGCGSYAAYVHDAVAIGNGIMPESETVNIGGRIVCNANGLSVNGELLESAGKFRKVADYFEKSYSDGYEFYGRYLLADFKDPPYENYSTFAVYNLMVVAEKTSPYSCGFDSLKVSWTVPSVEGKRNHEVTVEENEFDAFTPNVYSNEWRSSCDNSVYAQYQDVYTRFNHQTYTNYYQVMKAHLDAYSITVTTNRITISIRQRCGDYYQGESDEVSHDYVFNLSELDDAGEYVPFSRVVDCFAKRGHTRRLISSDAVAKSIEKKISGCAIKYENGALNVYTESGELIGTLTVN